MATMIGKKKKRDNQPEEGENGLHKVRIIIIIIEQISFGISK